MMYFVSGAIAESVSGLIWTPLEIIKQKQQVEWNVNKRALQLFRTIYRESGLKGFYRVCRIFIKLYSPSLVLIYL